MKKEEWRGSVDLWEMAKGLWSMFWESPMVQFTLAMLCIMALLFWLLWWWEEGRRKR